MMSKKSQEAMSEWPFWIMYGIAVGVIASILSNFGNVSVAHASAIPKDLEDATILVSRFYNSEACFAYQDDAGRVHPGMIESSKFIQQNMGRCFPESDVNYAFSLSLEQVLPPGVFGPVWNFNTLPINTFNWAGGFAQKEIIENIFVMHEGIKYDGKLLIKIQNAK